MLCVDLLGWELGFLMGRDGGDGRDGGVGGVFCVFSSRALWSSSARRRRQIWLYPILRVRSCTG